jgi:hypothetical protein
MARPFTDSWPTPDRMWAEPVTSVSGQNADFNSRLSGPWHGRWPTVHRPLADRSPTVGGPRRARMVGNGWQVAADIRLVTDR